MDQVVTLVETVDVITSYNNKIKKLEKLSLIF